MKVIVNCAQSGRQALLRRAGAVVQVNENLIVSGIVLRLTQK